MSFTLPFIASISIGSDLSEVLQKVVGPGFLLVVLVLGLLALVTQLIGVLFTSFAKQDSAPVLAGAQVLTTREYAVVAAAVHCVLRQGATTHDGKSKEVRIVSIEKKS